MGEEASPARQGPQQWSPASGVATEQGPGLGLTRGAPGRAVALQGAGPSPPCRKRRPAQGSLDTSAQCGSVASPLQCSTSPSREYGPASFFSFKFKRN